MTPEQLAAAMGPTARLTIVVLSLLAVWLVVRIVVENTPTRAYWVVWPVGIVAVVSVLASYRDDAPLLCFAVACLTGVAVILETFGIHET